MRDENNNRYEYYEDYEDYVVWDNDQEMDMADNSYSRKHNTIKRKKRYNYNDCCICCCCRGPRGKRGRPGPPGGISGYGYVYNLVTQNGGQILEEGDTVDFNSDNELLNGITHIGDQIIIQNDGIYAIYYSVIAKSNNLGTWELTVDGISAISSRYSTGLKVCNGQAILALSAGNILRLSLNETPGGSSITLAEPSTNENDFVNASVLILRVS